MIVHISHEMASGISYPILSIRNYFIHGTMDCCFTQMKKFFILIILIKYLSCSRLSKDFVQLQRLAKTVQQGQLRPTFAKMRRSEELCQWKR